MDYRKEIKDNIGETKRRHQLIILRNENIDGCIRYRMDMPTKALSLNSDDYFMSWRPVVNDDNLYFADLLFWQQPTMAMMGEYKIYKFSHMHNVKNLIDYNDDVFNIPASNPAYVDEGVQKSLKEMITHSDGVTVTVWPMRDVIIKDNPNVAIVPNYFDMATYTNLLITPEEARARWEKRGKVTRLGYVGSANHTEDQDVFFEAATQIMRERNDVEICVFGFLPEKLVKEFGARIKIQKFGPVSTYYNSFHGLGVDILCNPLINDAFNKCKSNIKWLEGTYLGCSVIASPIPSFDMLGEDCCRTVPWDEDRQAEVMAWRHEIENMLDNPDERYEMQGRSLQWMIGEWDIARGWHNWDTVFKRVLNGESIAGLDFTPRRHDVIQSVKSADPGGSGMATGGEAGTEPESCGDYISIEQGADSDSEPAGEQKEGVA